MSEINILYSEERTQPQYIEKFVKDFKSSKVTENNQYERRKSWEYLMK